MSQVQKLHQKSDRNQYFSKVLFHPYLNSTLFVPLKIREKCEFLEHRIVEDLQQ